MIIKEKMCRLMILLFIYITVSINNPPLHCEENWKECLIHTNNCSPEELLNIIYFIEEQGGQVYHVFPPAILQARINGVIEQSLKRNGIVRFVSETSVSNKEEFNNLDDPGIISWNSQFKPKSKGLFNQGGIIYNDMFFAPMNEVRIKGIETRKRTSAYMAGACAVSIVFVSCDGSKETPLGSWTKTKKDLTISQIRDGLDWWAKQGEKKAHLTWIYDVQDINVGAEPSSHPNNQDSIWVREAIQKLYWKYPHYTHYFQCLLYIDELRERLKTDWSFMIFVCENSGVPDGYFLEGGFAYAYVGGPYMVLTYKNNGWGPDQLWRTVAHETGHIFFALDEYKEAMIGPRKSGMLNVENGNHELFGVLSEECLMKNHSTHLCKYTLGQIGWWDENNDGHFDPDDTYKHPNSSIVTIPDTIKYGEIVINTIPENASVYLGGIFKGTTPLHIKDLKFGKHDLKIIKSGHLEHREELNISNSASVQKEISLKVVDEIEALSEKLINDNQEIMINASIDKPSYRIGDNLYVSFNTNVDCYFYLIDIDADKKFSIVFPDKRTQNNFIRANEKYIIPADNATFDFNVKGPSGKDRLIFLASREPLKEIENISEGEGTAIMRRLTEYLQGFPKDRWASRLLYFTIE